MSSDDFFIDTGTRHQVFLQRYGTGLTKRYTVELYAISREVARRLEKSTIPADDLSRLNALQVELNRLIDERIVAASAPVISQIESFAEAEVAFAATAIGKATNLDTRKPALNQVNAAIQTKKMGPTNLNVEKSFDKFGNEKASLFKKIIRDGFTLGTPTAEIADQLREIEPLVGRQAEALVRTSVNHLSQVARAETSVANADIVEGDIYTATLDSRTTLICGSRDGKKYPLGEPRPEIPAHYNCRSLYVPYLKEEFDIDVDGERASVGADGPKPVSGTLKFDGWLRRQGADFQNEYFSKFKNGDEKAKLFRQGRLKIGKFVDAKGAEYTLDELVALNPVETARANLV